MFGFGPSGPQNPGLQQQFTFGGGTQGAGNGSSFVFGGHGPSNRAEGTMDE